MTGVRDNQFLDNLSLSTWKGQRSKFTSDAAFYLAMTKLNSGGSEDTMQSTKLFVSEGKLTQKFSKESR